MAEPLKVGDKLPANFDFSKPFKVGDRLPADFDFGPAPAKATEPGSPGFWDTVWNRINPAPAVQEFLNRPKALRDITEAAATSMSLRTKGSDGKWTRREPTPEEKAIIDRGMQAHMNMPEGNILLEAAEPAISSAAHVKEGEYGAAAGDLVGGYAVPAAVAAVVPKIPGAVRATAGAVADAATSPLAREVIQSVPVGGPLVNAGARVVKRKLFEMLDRSKDTRAAAAPPIPPEPSIIPPQAPPEAPIPTPQPPQAQPQPVPLRNAPGLSSASPTSLAEQLKAMALESGTVTPEQTLPGGAAPTPTAGNPQPALAKQMRPLSPAQRKAVADANYRGGGENVAETYEAGGRATKTEKLRDALVNRKEGPITADQAKAVEGDAIFWEQAAKAAGVPNPGKATISQVIFELRKLEQKAKKPATPPTKKGAPSSAAGSEVPPVKPTMEELSQSLKDEMEKSGTLQPPQPKVRRRKR